MHYLAVAPLAVTRRDTYTYQSDVPVPAGAVATIPYASRQATGVVIGPAEPQSNAKPLQETGEQLPEWALPFARQLADQYLAPLGLVMKLLLPAWRPNKTAPPISGRTTMRVVKPGLLTSPNPWPEYVNLLARAEGQRLIVVPEAALTKRELPNAVRFTATLPIKERRTVWERVQSDLNITVLGTRSALFLPWQNLQLIIVEQEDELGHLNERSPRFHAREAARELAQQTGARLTLASPAPSLRAWMLAGQPKLTIDSVSNLQVIHRRGGARRLPFGLIERLREAEGTVLLHTTQGRIADTRAAIKSAGQRRVTVNGQAALFQGKSYDTVISLGIDALLSRPGYMVTERAVSLLRKLSACVASGGELIAYSKHPDHPAFAAAKQPYAEFLQGELRERLALRLPPAAPLVRISTRSADLDKLKKQLASSSVPARDIRTSTQGDEPTVLIKAEPAGLRDLITPERRITVDY